MTWLLEVGVFVFAGIFAFEAGVAWKKGAKRRSWAWHLVFCAIVASAVTFFPDA